MTCLTFENIGYVAAIYVGLKLSIRLLGCLKALVSSPTNVGKMGEWALVTGSTDGIGKAYAFALAKRGLNIILVSRSPFKLQNVAAEIENKYTVKTKIVDIDFSSSDEQYIPRLEKELKGLEIGVLVNNVGMSYEYPDEFLALEDKRMKDMIAINITALNAMTRFVLPGMEKRGRGAIINIGSLSSAVASPMLAVYAASKAYVDKLTVALNQEYGRKGIVIQGRNSPNYSTVHIIRQKFYTYSHRAVLLRKSLVDS
jgi:17beta-estradiol 17-dehydrogenase / very-long-chain 3-oxoacyl-CoA reductase